VADVNVNVGCGEFPAAGWLNLDLTHEAADRRWDIRDGLPPDVGPVERIYLGHVLEHLAYDEIVPMLRLMPAGALVGVVGPDCDRAEAMGMPPDELALLEHGGGRWSGDVHQWRSTAPLTVGLLWRAGWRVMPVGFEVLEAEGFPLTSKIGWQFALLALVP
jgi:hypothetical protein